MTLKNLKLALQLNNAEYNKEINLIIDYLNQFVSDNKYDLYITNNRINDLDIKIGTVNGNLTYIINQQYTYFYDAIGKFKDEYEKHSEDTIIHVSQDDRDKWDAAEQNAKDHSDAELKKHTDDLVIHVTQNDKDLWNATLQNAKTYAKELFDKLTSFEIIKCTELPTEDIQLMTIYFLQIDPEQDDLYEEYMYLDGQWEKIGNTRIDLSDYVTKSMLETELDKVQKTIKDLSDSVSQTIGTSDTKHQEDVDAINKNLKDNYEPYVHDHDNKDVLDQFTSDYIVTDEDIQKAVQDILKELNKEGK